MIITSERISLKHLLTAESLSDQEVMGLIERAQEFKRGAKADLKNQQYFTANLFFENSTRTHKSFEVAEKKLGLDVIEFDAKTSSVSKGESLYDTVLTMSAIGVHACVIRHWEEDYYNELIQSKTITTSIINGGDGSGNHPTQCLLDLLTIYEEFGYFDNLDIAICGDLTHSRVANSNMKMLKRLGANLYFCGPEEWYNQKYEAYGTFLPIDEVVSKVDVMMMLRVQHERHEENESFSKEGYHLDYGLIEVIESSLGMITKDKLEKYVKSKRWKKDIDQNDFAWVSIKNFWCVNGKYLARENNNNSSFNKVLGRKKYRANQLINNNDASKWLAGSQKMSKKVFSFKNPPRTFGFVKPDIIDFEQMKKRLEDVWGDENNWKFIQGDKILESLVKKLLEELK